ncbi:hypothetical protein DICPUDRAFT_88866 [Dictyostelium purpureum]|uniref:Uncharacterized protein n=1 Tax=Dictyostelium purpureum TaxID=5786 RepID=F0ZS47_DICPU|nr:uncharacterized protein DICPUDRAFT_88866 [Dictyostelium purpureum]EGC33250.1 hypothetical protein DICPUDRAFT_88866 [Dictyostelium purpureum]|eukprot:XP_003290243.1 hypothetical protein DICPUDRAFT_88866 [Dictyostelium purpureum]
MDKKIKIWDLNKAPIFHQMNKSYYLEASKTLEIHKSSLKFLEKIPNGFCSVSNDDDLIIWSEDGELTKNIVRKYKEYTHGILCVNSYILVAGSSSPFLVAYKYDSQNEPAKTLGETITHKDCISSLFNVSSKHFVTGSKDQSIIIWDSETLSPIHQLYCKQPINYLYPINNFILATIKKGFSIFDIMNGTTVLEHVPTEIEDNTTTELNGAVTLYDHTKILTWADHRVSVWNWPYESVLGTSGSVYNINNLNSSGGGNKKRVPLKPTFIGDMKGHTDYINCVTVLSENSIATGSSDCNIILWKDGKVQSESRTFLSNHMNDSYAKTSSQYIEHYIDEQQDYNDDPTFEQNI